MTVVGEMLMRASVVLGMEVGEVAAEIAEEGSMVAFAAVEESVLWIAEFLALAFVEAASVLVLDQVEAEAWSQVEAARAYHWVEVDKVLVLARMVGSGKACCSAS